MEVFPIRTLIGPKFRLECNVDSIHCKNYYKYCYLHTYMVVVPFAEFHICLVTSPSLNTIYAAFDKITCPKYSSWLPDISRHSLIS